MNQKTLANIKQLCDTIGKDRLVEQYSQLLALKKAKLITEEDSVLQQFLLDDIEFYSCLLEKVADW